MTRQFLETSTMTTRFLFVLLVIAAWLPLRVQAQNNGLIYQIPSSEYNALVALYADASGPGWRNSSGWTNANATNWQGVTISGVQYDGSGNVLVPGHVVSLELGFNRLFGNISTNVGDLTQLTYLDLGDNQLTGTIPDGIGGMSQLQSLYLSPNILTGSIPASLGNLSQLQNLYLDQNELTSNIPASLGNLSQLQNLDLHFNELTGYIPAALGNLSRLQNLSLSQNSLTGPIPATLGNLSRLITLELDDNQLNGSIPVTLGNLPRLLNLGLGGNKLSGDVPDFTAFTNVTISIEENFLNSGTGSQSLANINAMIAAGNTVVYVPQFVPYTELTVEPANLFGFYITGPPGIEISVSASTNLALPVWAAIQSCGLTNGSIYFHDPQWTNYPRRFYRVSSP